MKQLFLSAAYALIGGAGCSIIRGVSSPPCGEGFIQEPKGEECDDANTINTDACTNAICGDQTSNDSRVFQGDRTGNFIDPKKLFEGKLKPQAAIVDDLNNDSAPDLVASFITIDQISILLSRP